MKRKIAFFTAVIGVLLWAFYLYLDEPQPMFKLNEPGYDYQITKFENSYGVTYWVQQIKPGSVVDESGFKGSAMKVRGASFKLDEYLDQNVKLEGKFYGRGEHTYYLESVERL